MTNLRIENKLSSDLACRGLKGEQLDRLNACRSSHRFLAYRGKTFISYMLERRPKLLNSFTCVGVSLSLEDGFCSTWEAASGETVEVGHTPVEVAPNCFIWHVFDSQVRYMPFNGMYSVSFPLAYSTIANPFTHTEGKVYLLEEAIYDSLFNKA